MFHFIFEYNYGNFWQILIIFLLQETEMNTLPHVYKLFYFNLTMSPLYMVKLKMTQKQPTAYAVHSVELIVPDFWKVKRSWHATCHSYDVIELVSK